MFAISFGAFCAFAAIYGAEFFVFLFQKVHFSLSPAVSMLLESLLRIVFFMAGFLIYRHLFGDYQIKTAVLSGIGIYFLICVGGWFLKTAMSSRI
jgi:hypothetical protein